MSEYTKGEWMQMGTSVGVTDGEICACYTNGMQFDAMANARLIAAAPDLLEALIHLEHNARKSNAEMGMALDVARAAISKAKGEQND